MKLDTPNPARHHLQHRKLLKIIPAYFTILFLSIYILSCSKSDSPATNSFTWTFRDTTYTAKSDTAYLSGLSATPVLVASEQPTLNARNAKITITSTSFTTGTHTFGQGELRLEYVDKLGNFYNGGSGTLNITSSQNNRLSGNFSLIVGGSAGDIYPLTGNFSNVPVKP